MPLRLSDLVANRRLGLRTLAGREALDRPVSWVHVSELDDPTPFLDGGELLLTTGLGIRPTADLVGFVARLVRHGLTGIGFGTGLSHDLIPAALVAAARDAGLPLLEVPKQTPFIAISKLVSAAVAADSYAAVTTTNTAQQELTRAALGRHGVAGVVRRLASLLDAWVLLLDRVGTVVHAAPVAAVRRRDPLSAEIDRLRGRGRLASSSFRLAEDHVVAQVLGSQGQGFLVVGRPARWDRAGQQILGAAASLLTLSLARTATLDRTHRQLRTGLWRLLVAGQVELAAQVVADLWGWPLPAAPATVFAFAGGGAARSTVLELLELGAGNQPDPVFFAECDGRVVGLAADGQWLERLPDQVPGLFLGLSEPVDHTYLADGHRQANQAVEAAMRTRTPRMRFADLAGGRLLGLLPAQAAQAFAESLLAPLLRHDEQQRGDLVESLRQWLRHHGQWDPAAARLGVHRHTLRNRIRKVAVLLDRDLDSPGTRAELWFALQLRETGQAGPRPAQVQA